MKKQLLALFLVSMTASQIQALNPLEAFGEAPAPPTSGGGGGGFSLPGMPELGLDLSFDFSTREINIDGKCYTDMNQNVRASGGSQVMITNGNCDNTNVSSMGKAGDLKRFNIASLKAQNLGNVSATQFHEVALPTVGEKNAALLTFVPASPEGSRLVPGRQLQGRQVQILLKTRDLTRALATAEEAEWITGKGQVLLELWARTSPSVFGSDDFKQFASLAFLKSQVGQKFAVGVEPNGSVSLNFSAIDPSDASKKVYYQLEGNVTSQKP